MHLPPDLILNRPIGNTAPTLTMNVSQAMFCNLVRAACAYFNNIYNTHGISYEEPKQYRGFKDSDVYLTNVRYIKNHNIRKDLFNTDSAHSAHFEIFVKYIEYKNEFPNEYLVCSDGLDIMVYLTAHHIHEHRVKVIEITHKESGKNFGSATAFQKFDLFALVKDWPTRYKFKEYIVELHHTPLPKDRPGYFDDAGETSKNVTEVDVGESRTGEN